MNELILRNMNYNFYCLGTNIYLTSFYNADNNNMILFDTSDCDEITVESICNSTVSNGAYDYLTNILNTNKNVLVYWSQIEGTTSDYIIYYDSDNEAIINDEVNVSKVLEITNSGCEGYKFTEVRNKKQSKINFNN